MNVADKIRKLLALAQSSNPHEAALAAARAQELMVKYAIEESEIGASAPGSVPEPIGSEAMGAGKGGTSYWQASLAQAMARSFFCHSYFTPGSDVFMVGRKSDREAFRATWFYVRDEIARMCDAAWEHERAKAPSYLSGARLAGYATRWKRAFSIGAVRTVGQRLASSLKELTAGAPGTAIVLANRQLAVSDWVKANLRLRSSGSARPVMSNGYSAGKAAGWTLNLDKRASKRLAA